MKDVMEYKDYIGSVHFEADDEIFFGKIEAINDLVMFEGQSVQELKKAFHDAVDDYLATCEKMGREPNKTSRAALTYGSSVSCMLRLTERRSKRG